MAAVAPPSGAGKRVAKVAVGNAALALPRWMATPRNAAAAAKSNKGKKVRNDYMEKCFFFALRIGDWLTRGFC